MKKYILVVMVLSLILFTVACQFQIKFTEELLKETFDQHQQSFTYYADRFDKQNLVLEAQMTYTQFGTRYYTLRAQASADRPQSETTFKVPAKFFNDDEDFWENDPGRIISTKKTGAMTLRELFQIQKMTALDFHLWRLFLRNNKFYSIGRSSSGEQIEIHASKTTGYIYCPEVGSTPAVEAGVNLVKLTGQWYYFLAE